MELVQEEDVIENIESICVEEDHIIDIEEFIVNNDIQKTLNGAFGLAVEVLKKEGYENFMFVHSRYGHQVSHLVKGHTVIVAYYHGTNLITLEVLPKNEAEAIIKHIKKFSGKK